MYNTSASLVPRPCLCTANLFECVACDGLESLFYVDGLLGAGLKVGDVILALAPGLCSLSGYLEEAE